MTVDREFNRCPACGADIRPETSDQFGDWQCPNCARMLFFARAGQDLRFFAYPEAGPLRMRLIDFLSTQLGVPKEKITPDMAFIKDAEVDSLDVLEILMEIEQERSSE